MNSDSTFDIREFTDKLTPVGGEKWICPVCEGNNLSIARKTGKYQCWNGCECKDIREAIAPLPKKEPRPSAKHEYLYTDRNGRPLIKVSRIDDGTGKKRIWQSSWDGKNWVKGLLDEVRSQIPIYRYLEIQEAIAAGKPIFLVEGESCADALWELGVAATTTLGGAGKYRKYGHYKEDLEGAQLILCPDRDTPGLAHMEDAAIDFPQAKWLYAPPNDFYWSHLPPNGGLDIKDWIEAGAKVEQILEAIEDRRVAVESLEKNLEAPAAERREAHSKNLQLINFIEREWGDRLRLNELDGKIELDGKPLPLARAWFAIAKELDIDVSQTIAASLLVEIARDNSYSPVREYLQSLPNGDASLLDNLAERYLGTSDKFHATLLKRTLIGAVARVFEPGCKLDTLCIFQSKQGRMKSTFWKTLASAPWFTDNLSDSEKDEKLKLRRYWILEFSEFETAYRRKEVAQLKSFLSSPVDSLRVPYGREIEDFPRTSIFVGSTNSTEFLHDSTGERRYWVIPVSKKIDIAQLEEERDEIWAAAIAAYKAGEQWWLTPEEDLLLAEANREWESNDSWEPSILKALKHESEASIPALLEKVIGLELARQDKSSQMRVADILRRNGWEKSRNRRERLWTKPVTTSEGGHEVVTEVVTPETLVPQSFEKSVTTVTTFLQENLSESLPGAKNLHQAPIKGEESSEKGGHTEKNESLEPLPINDSSPVTTSEKEPRAEDIADALGWIREAIEHNDPDIARPIYSVMLDQGERFYLLVWQNLTPNEQAHFRRLIQ